MTPSASASSSGDGPVRQGSLTFAPSKRQPLRKLSPEQVAEAERLYRAGWSLSKTAAHLSVSRQAMWDLLRRRLILRDRLKALPRKPRTAIRAKRAATIKRYRSRAARITVLQMRAVMARDQVCRGCGQPGNEYDHIEPVALGGQTTMDNLQLLCPPCHREKSRTDRRRCAERR